MHNYDERSPEIYFSYFFFPFSFLFTYESNIRIAVCKVTARFYADILRKYHFIYPSVGMENICIHIVDFISMMAKNVVRPYKAPDAM